MSTLHLTPAGVRVLLFGADGAPVRGDGDAVDLIGAAFGRDIAWIALPVERLGDGFFTLSTRIAGEVVQKFVNYGVSLCVIGDISGHVAASNALRDFVYESNRGRHLWFVDSLDELDRRLAQSSNPSSRP
jgi:hypothetical protein